MKLISSAALVAIQAGDIAEAVNKLEKALARTDGCVLRGSPDGNGKVETGSPIAAPCSIYMAISAPRRMANAILGPVARPWKLPTWSTLKTNHEIA